MADTRCTPPCDPNAAVDLPGAVAPTPNPGARTVQADTCAGTVDVTVGANATQVALLPGQVVYTKKCPGESEFDTVTLCDADGNPKLVVITYSDAGVPTATAYNPDGTAFAGAVADLKACSSNLESDPVEVCDTGVSPTVSFVRWYVKKNGEPTGATFDTDKAGAPYVATGPVVLGRCDEAARAIFIETGCLCSAPKIDLNDVEKCHVGEVKIDGVSYLVDLAEGWSSTEFVTAVNAAAGSTILTADGSVVTINLTPPKAVVPVEIVCTRVDFLEDFGTGARTTSANTNYTYAPNGMVLDGKYAVTNFGDNLGDFNTSEFQITADQSGDPNGRALIVNADFAAGEFYRQLATDLEPGAEYRVQFYAISTIVSYAQIKPNIKVDLYKADGVTLRATKATGNLTNRTTWKGFTTDFVATETEATFVLVNNSPGGDGNDLAIDTITFSKIYRRVIPAKPRDKVIPVEIVKMVDDAGAVKSVRIFSPDGATEYTGAYVADGLILTVGECPDVTNLGSGYSVAYSVPYPVCVTNAGTSTTWYMRSREVSLDVSGTKKSTTTEYSADGVDWQEDAPTGTIVAGACASTGTSTSTTYERRCYCVDRNGVSTKESFVVGLNPNGQVITVVDMDAASTVIAGAGDGDPITVDLAMWQAYDATITGFALVDCASSAGSAPAAKEYRTTVRDIAAGAAVTIAPTGNLVSWTVRNRSSTTGTVSVNGGAALPLDVGETMSSGIEEGSTNFLSDTVTFTAGNGIIRLTELRRV